jgi:hypothetical protein
MRWSDLPLSPSPATLRWFGVLAAFFLAGLAGWQFVVHDRAVLAGVLGGAALAVGLVGLGSPQLLRPVFVGWMVLLFPVNWLVSHLVLACLFYCIFTPVGLFFRLVGRDALARRFHSEQDTYWVDKPGGADVHSYFRQS